LAGRDVVPADRRIRGQHDETFDLRLRHEQSIDRIAMDSWQRRSAQGMREIDRQ